MIDLLFVGARVRIRLADALRYDLRVAAFVASVLAVGALHARSILEEISTQRTSHDVVEGLRSEFVAVLLHHILLLLPDSTFPAKSNCIEAFPLLRLLHEAERKLDSADGFQ